MTILVIKPLSILFVNLAHWLHGLAQMKVQEIATLNKTQTKISCIFQDEDRRSLLRTLSDEQYKDVIRVLSTLPLLSVEVNTEVVDDEDQHVVTAGAIITVTLIVRRR